MNGTKLRVAVIGGGVSGLAAAHRLLELSAERGIPLHLALFEASNRLGGVISTLSRDGFLIEEGPDSIVTDKPWGRALAERLGLGHRLVGTLDTYRKSFVVRRGRLAPTPDGFYLMAPTRLLPLATTPIFSPLGKLRMAMDLILPPRRTGGDESVGSFVRRRLGREALERIAQPMIGGIYGVDPDELSLMATFPRFRKMEEEHGSVIRAMIAARRRAPSGSAAAAPAKGTSGARYGLFVSFDAGLQVLTDALVSRLPPGAARLGEGVSNVSPRGNGGERVWAVMAGAREETFDALVLSVRAPDAARLVAPFDGKLSRALESIRYGSSATVSLGFRETDVRHPLDGVGFVVPRVEGISISGCTFLHRKYPGRAPSGYALVRAFWGDASLDLDEAALRDRTIAELSGLLGVAGPPVLVHVARWPRAMPHYAVGHLERVEALHRLAFAHPGLALAGNAFGGVGIPDCIHGGERAAEAIMERIPTRAPS